MPDSERTTPLSTACRFWCSSKVKLRVEDLDDKERDYVVVSMTPRESDSQTASAH
jgi:hypothetical protein